LHESFQTVTSEGFDQQVATNLKGPFFLSQRVLAYMEQNQVKGQVLFVSSETGETADIRPYGLTKAAVNSLVQGLAYLYAKQGIRVNAIAPGVTASAMTGFNADENLNCSYNVGGRAYLPEEMAEVAAFLLSDASGCISGQIITCNNGNTVNARWK
jgi:3-oxoacyl-[acyl-carrier protein] reductase